jgi:sugar/nucleoside kinase (ribokinase family)
VTFAAVQAHRLGRSVGIVTSAAPDVIERLRSDLPFAEIASIDADATTTFENIYDGGHRTQYIREQGAPIGHDAVPAAWRDAPVVLLGALWAELAPDFAAAFAPDSLVGVSAQGYLRAADSKARVRHTTWRGAPFWTGSDVLFVSDEDLGDERDDLARWQDDVPVVVMTASSRGAHVYADKHWRRLDAYPQDEIDPTGAGDTFATGFLIRLHESGDVADAARFGSAAASLSVRGVGAASMPERAEVEERMRQYPDVGLR